MMNEDLRGLSGLMRDKGFTRPQGFENGGGVTANQMMGATQAMGTPRNTQIELDGKAYDTNSINYSMGTAPRGLASNQTNYSMGTAPESSAPDMASIASDMRARQEMQKAELMGQLVDLVGSANPEVVKMLENAPVSELMKAVQEIQDAGGIVKKAAGGPIRYFENGGAGDGEDARRAAGRDSQGRLIPPHLRFLQTPPPETIPYAGEPAEQPLDMSNHAKYANDILKMSVGLMDMDPRYDANQDGVVNTQDSTRIRHMFQEGTPFSLDQNPVDTSPPLPPPPPESLTKYKKYAQDALMMMTGQIPENLEYDFDGDGQVTLADSSSFLRGSTGMMGDDFNFEIANPARYQQDIMQWAETNELDINNLSPEQIETAKADYATYQSDFDANKVDYYGQPIIVEPDPVIPPPPEIIEPVIPPPPEIIEPVIPPPPPPPPPVVPPPPPPPTPPVVPPPPPTPPVVPPPPPPPPPTPPVVPPPPPPPPPVAPPPPLPTIPGPPPPLPVMPGPPPFTSGNPFAGNMAGTAGTANDPYGITQARPQPNPISGPQGGPLRRPYATTQNRYIFGQRGDR